MQDTVEIIDREIGHFMVDNKLTQAEMATLLEMEESTLSLKRRGRRQWKLSEAERLADVMHKSLDELTGRKK